MKIYQFEIFTTVAQVKSFSKAANLLYLSQPAVSKHIKSMEKYYGTKLFNRSRQGATLTPAGQKVYDYAKDILQTHDELEKEIDKYLNLENMNLRIGASVTPGEYLLPCTIWTFKDKHPKININLQIDNSQKIIKQVLKNEIDIGIIEDEIPTQANLTTEIILEDELKFVGSVKKNCPEELNFRDLTEIPLILLNDDFGIRQKFNHLLKMNNINNDELNIVAEMDSITAIKSAVESGLGFSVVSYSSIKKEIYQNLIKDINIKDIEDDKLKIKFKLINNTKREQLNIIDRFITFLTIQNEHAFC